MKSFFCILMLLASFAQPAAAFAKNDELGSLVDQSRTDDEAAAHFQKSALMSFEFLRAKGVEKLGPYNLKQLIDEIKTVQWRFTFPGINISAGQNGGRHSAIYSVRDKMVIVSLNEWNKEMPMQRPLLASHEALCALGYDDTTYSLTSLMSAGVAARNLNPPLTFNLQKYNETLSEFQSGLLSEPSLKIAPPIKATPVFRSGGVTGVGGGGDGDLIYMKSAMVMGLLAAHEGLPDRIFKSTWNYRTFLNMFINADLEEDPNQTATLDPVSDFNMTTISIKDDQMMIRVPKGAVSLLCDNNPDSKLFAAYIGRLAQEISKHVIK